mgnify:CR=1 FL=1
MNIKSILIALFLFLFCTNSLMASTLVIEVNDIKNKKGQILVALFDQSEGFPSDQDKSIRRKVGYIKDGKATFGAPVFVQSARNGQRKSRIVLQYSAEAKIVCNYDEFEKYIIVDHLMAMGGDIPGTESIKIPDGTFEGYQLQNGLWTYIPKMFHTVVEEAPRETPVLDKGSKDILGRKKGEQ